MTKSKHSSIKSAVDANASSSSILGTYEGESMDTNITNNNGLDITREVIEYVLDSEDYERGIKYGWFIGFLGHPEDPGCMDFERGCIVMTDMSINDDGKVHAKFNLIDTPVGRIVKTFIDAGVQFGISIRGAGDIIGHSVDPETFVFRGYDLVAFPAFPESIPTFTGVAASTNIETQKKYKAVCAAVKTNLPAITSCSEIDIIQSQFAPQSEEYKMLQKRRDEIESESSINLDKEKLEAMTMLYVECSQQVGDLMLQVENLKRSNTQYVCESERKLKSLKRITSAQLNDTLKDLNSYAADYNDVIAENTRLNAKLKSVSKDNLIYKQKVKSSSDELRNKDHIIASLKSDLSETVTASTDIKASASNLGETNKRLNSEIRACKQMLRDFQSAYANIYANALGVDLGHLSITASTTVDDIHKMVSGAMNSANMPSATIVEPVFVGDIDEDDDDDNLVTM